MNFESLKAIAIPQGNVIKIRTIVNLMPTSIDTDGSIFNGCGYQDGVRVRSSGELGTAQYSSATGYIPVVGGETIKFKGGNWDIAQAGNCICFCDSSFNALGSFTKQPNYYGICTADNCVVTTEGDYHVLTIPDDSSIAYLRLSMYVPDANYDAYHGKDLVVLTESGTKMIWKQQTYTIELVKGTGYTIAAVDGFNTTVIKGNNFSFTVELLDGYIQEDDFAVKVNGNAISEVDGVYTISNVTENMTITVEGVAEAPTYKYTNLVPLSIASDGSIYNGTGYKENYRLSSSSGNESTGTNGIITGFIKVTASDVIRIASKGDIINWPFNNATNCIHYYNSSKSTVGYLMGKGTYSGVCTAENSVVTEEVYRKKYRLTVPNDSSIEWIRVGIYCPNGPVGDDLIVTVNEEIIDVTS